MLFALFFVCGVYLSGCLGFKPQYGFKGYTKYETGTMKLILTAPHDGGHDPPRQYRNWKWRPRKSVCKTPSTCKCVWRSKTPTDCKKKYKCKAGIKNDLHTYKITQDIADKIKVITGDRPHVVYNELRRSKLDANREISEATFNVRDAKRAYYDYHGFIKKAIKAVGANGLLLDIHGQAHKSPQGQRTELGYLISRQRLNSGRYSYDKTSIKRLAERKCRYLWHTFVMGHCFKALISGKKSLGYYMSVAGLRTVPSPSIKKPGSPNGPKDGYFSGGYTVKTYGSNSRFKRNVDAIQIEFPNGVRNNWKRGSKISAKNKMRNRIVFAILCFFKEHYNYSPPTMIWQYGWLPKYNPQKTRFDSFTKSCKNGNFIVEEM